MSELSNADLAPVPEHKRTWNATNYFSLWVGMCVCIPSYMMASGLVSAGMSTLEALSCVLLGNLIVVVPMVLNGKVGAKYGIPYPVYARASFGIYGSNLPALLRALVACGWFGIQTWIGGTAIFALVALVWPPVADLPDVMPGFMEVGTGPFVCFLVFWLVNLAVIFRGPESIKWLETVAAPFLLGSGLLLLFWALKKLTGEGGPGLQVLFTPSRFKTDAEFWKVFAPSLTGMVGFWATMSLNIPDFTRYAKNQRSQVVGQILGLPTTMTLFALIGVVVTKATEVLYGAPLWDPVMVVKRFEGPLVVFCSMAMILLATLSTNVAANVVGPANDFSNLFPKAISFQRGGMITALLGLLMMPWKLISDPSGYIFTWLIGYSSLLGPIGGILLVDYFLLRKETLHVADLYRLTGRYRYRGGVNPLAVLAFVLGVLPNLPGFLFQVKAISEVHDIFKEVYRYAWFVGLPLSGAVYYLLSVSFLGRRFSGALKRDTP